MQGQDRRNIARLASALGVIGVVLPALAQQAPDPKEAGARYGQALGAVLACPGFRPGAGLGPLMSRFSGSDLETFKAQAARVLGLWQQVKTCNAAAAGPDQCQVVQVKSCREALAEVGPTGTQQPRLIEPEPR